MGIVGVIGTDFPDSYRGLLTGCGVDIQGLYEEEGTTFRWRGRYQGDLGQADPLHTDLGVFAGFRPEVPAGYEKSYLFLGNIDPDLQMHVTESVPDCGLIALDTMNFWIEGKREALLKVIARSHLLLVNDEEARMLSGERNLVQAAKKLLELGPEAIIIKRGEHGSSVHTGEHIRMIPALPLDDVRDTTGAGDTFAGAMVAYLARTGKRDADTLALAAAMGTVMASFTVSDFSLNGLMKADRDAIVARLNTLMELTHLAEM